MDEQGKDIPEQSTNQPPEQPAEQPTERPAPQPTDPGVDPIKSAIITDEEYEDSLEKIHATIDKEEQAALAVAGESTPQALDARPDYAISESEQRVSNAYLLEVVGGIFGLLGLGYIYAGRHESGILRLLGWWLVLGVMWGTVLLLSIILVGLCMIPLALLVQILVPIWSAGDLKRRMLTEGP